jgi:hypothetical protein
LDNFIYKNLDCILGSGNSAWIECLPSKQKVAGSNPARSVVPFGGSIEPGRFLVDDHCLCLAANPARSVIDFFNSMKNNGLCHIISLGVL